MKTKFTIVLILSAFIINAQTNFKEFSGSGFGIVLPDSGYSYKEGRFYNKESHVAFFLMNQKADFSNLKFNEFQKIMLQELLTPGVTILSDVIVSADSSRIMKLVIDLDITDAKPATKGRKDVTWIYFYNYQGNPILLMASYPLESDKLLAESILTSLKTLSNIDGSKKLFKNSFSITENYAPLKYCGPSFSGIRLNMQGKYQLSGGDSSYCLIMPVTIALPKSKPDSMRTYLLTRLQIHAKTDIRVQSWSVGNSGKFILYEMVTEADDYRLLYLAIKSDDKGYFEIWGESFGNNKKLIPVFKNIAQSLQRN